MTKQMAEDLDRLRVLLMRMADLVEAAVRDAGEALFARDRELGRRVETGDDAVDRLENLLQEGCLRFFALYQPVAADLRWVGMAMLAATDLERVGDLAAGIARRVAAVTLMPPSPVPAGLAGMAERAGGMLRAAVEAFARRDAQAARAVIAADDAVDRDNAELIAELVARMKADPGAVEPSLSLFTVVRNLERVADHAAGIAEDAVYLAEGETIRHARPAVAPG
ncbi:MAG: phosphate signaling complex protein PhoU [Gemmataceae bacterium]|nr:phosphate signaling complex protein PhoU [Gemmataceae bacterium]